MARTLYAALVIVTLILGACSGSSSSPAILRAIVVSPASVSIAPGTTTPLKAIGYYTNGNNLDVTNSVTWSSSNTAAGTVSAQGVVTGVAAGSSTITASSAGVSGSATLTTSPVQSITVTPSNQTLLAGGTLQLKANGTLADGTPQDLSNFATWSSSNTGVATVTSPGGLVTGVSAGPVTVSASFGSASASTPLTVVTIVSIAPLTPANSVVAVGSTQQFAATGTLSDGTTRDVTTLVTWKSSNPAVATIAAGGLAKTLLPGTTTISASYGTVTQSTSFTAQGPTSITVTPANLTTITGATQQFSATGTFADGSTRDLTSLVTWSSSASNVATISNSTGSNGLASAAAIGTTTITATLGGAGGPFIGSTRLDVKSLSATGITVTPSSASVPLNSTIRLTARASFTDNTTEDLTDSVTWNSSNPSIASVSNAAGTSGVVTGNGLGTATVTAKLGTVTSAISTITVTSGGTSPTARAFVTNFGSNSVSVINTNTNTVVGPDIPVGPGPRGIAADASLSRVYVGNSDGTLSVINTQQNAVVDTITIGGSLYDVDVDTSTHLVYIANDPGAVSVFDPLTRGQFNIPVDGAPRGIAVMSGANKVYVTQVDRNLITQVDPAQKRVVASFGSQGIAPVDVAVNVSSRLLYVANAFSTTAAVFSTDDNSLASFLAVGSGAQVIAVTPVSPLQNRAYITMGGSTNTVSVINTVDNSLVITAQTGGIPKGVAVNPVKNVFYVANFGSNTVRVFNAQTNTFVTDIPVGTGPTYIAVIP
jgi:trimeric autotransporter adhesin